MEQTTPELKMTFMPSTIEHLGARLYSTIPPIIAELVANSLDADAHTVRIQLQDVDEKRVIVSDDGIGMSFDDISSFALAETDVWTNNLEETCLLLAVW